MTESRQFEGLLAQVELKKAGKVERKEQLLSLITEKPDVSREEMMATIGINEDILRTYVVELFNKGRLPKGEWTRFRHQGRYKIATAQATRRETRKGYLLMLLEDNPRISLLAIARALGVNKQTTLRYIRELDAEGHIPSGLLEAFRILHRERRRRARRRRDRKRRLTRKLSPERRRKRLLTLMRRTPTITVKDLASDLNVSPSTVKKVRAELRKEGFLNGKGRSLWVASNIFAAETELKARQILEILKADMEATRGEVAAAVDITPARTTTCIKKLRDRGDLPAAFRFKKKPSYEKVHRRIDERRQKRKAFIVSCISQNLNYTEIAYLGGVNAQSISGDVKAWLLIKDPEMLEAVRKRDEIRKSLRKPKTTMSVIDIMNRANKVLQEAVGLNLDQLNAENLEWLANSGPDDSYIREKILVS